MRLRPLLCTTLLAVAAATPPSSAGMRTPTVAPGYDLFETPDGSALGVTIPGVADETLMTFRGAPLGSFTFGDLGTYGTSTADTIVHRLDTATPDDPQVRIELVGLLLESTNVPGYYVTLQSIRPGGLPSIGTLDFTFSEDGIGGLLDSDLLVNYDVRRGAPDGPIVAIGSTGMGFAAEDILWVHSEEDAAAACAGDGVSWCYDPSTMCHEANITGVTHQHCVKDIIDRPLIPGVNYRLNGHDTTADFLPVASASE